MPTTNVKGYYLGETEEDWALSLEIERRRTNFCPGCGGLHMHPYNGGRRWGYRLRLWRCTRCRTTTAAKFDAGRLDLAFLLEDAPLHLNTTGEKIEKLVKEEKLPYIHTRKSATATYRVTSKAAVMAAEGSYNGEIPILKQSYQWAKEFGVRRAFLIRRASEFGIYPVLHRHISIYSDWQFDGVPMVKQPRPRITPGLRYISKEAGGYTVEDVYDDSGKQKMYTDWNSARETSRQAHVLHAPLLSEGEIVLVDGDLGVARSPLLYGSAGAWVEITGGTKFFHKQEIDDGKVGIRSDN
jgi:hypothetical protein